jgi:hypothetical protein
MHGYALAERAVVAAVPHAHRLRRCCMPSCTCALTPHAVYTAHRRRCRLRSARRADFIASRSRAEREPVSVLLASNRLLRRLQRNKEHGRSEHTANAIGWIGVHSYDVRHLAYNMGHDAGWHDRVTLRLVSFSADQSCCRLSTQNSNEWSHVRPRCGVCGSDVVCVAMCTRNIACGAQSERAAFA